VMIIFAKKHQSFLAVVSADLQRWYWLVCVEGVCAEMCAKNLAISREEQDEYAAQSYQRSQAAAQSGVFRQEIVPVTVTLKKGTTGSDDYDVTIFHQSVNEKQIYMVPFVVDEAEAHNVSK